MEPYLLQQDKVYIEYDGIEKGITDELVASGIPSEAIVLAFQPPLLISNHSYMIH